MVILTTIFSQEKAHRHQHSIRKLYACPQWGYFTGFSPI
jgi:hypothetical protein